ncbi:MAG: VCBS repeat-containing protein [Bryobacteraceae bacterium]|jgi:hypothetical protein
MRVKNWKSWGATIVILLAPGNLFPLAPISFNAPRAYPIGSTMYPGAPTSVAVADLNGDGYLDAVVAGFDGSYEGYSERGYVSVLLGKAGGGFLAQTQLDTGATGASGVVIADVNGDGKPDLVIAATVALVEVVSVMLGNGDGTFQAPVSYNAASAGSNGGTVAVGDFNGDGKPDIALTNSVANSASILLGNGDGTFQPAVAYAAGTGPEYLAVGDFNLDGNLDLVVNSKPGYVTILLGNGDGTFRAPVNYPALEYPGSVAVGDFNGDGKPDLAVSTVGVGDGPDFVRILLGNGDGTFQKPTPCYAGSGPVAVTVGDFNGDGKLDLAVGNQPFPAYEGAVGDTISIMLGKGDGTFQPPVAYTAGATPVALALGDFNGDGALDIAVADRWNPGGNLAILLGTPQGTVQHTVSYPVSPENEGELGFIAAGDFNGDGKPDMAVTDSHNNTVTILLNDSPEQFIYPVGLYAGPVVVGDFNRDGKLDLMVGNTGNATVSLLLGNGDGTFQPQLVYAVQGVPGALAIGDFNGDGNLDLAVLLGDNANDVGILLGNGDGTFQSEVNYALRNDLSVSAPTFIAVGDLNGDGHPDLIVDTKVGSFFYPSTSWILLGNGDGTFQPATYTLGGPGGYVALADVNGDGILDIVTAQAVYLGNGDATFRKPQPLPGIEIDGPFSSLTIADFNGDGKPDVAVLTDGMVGLLLGNGDGTFDWEASFVAGSPIAMAVADFNGDGLPDVAVASGLTGARTVALLTNTGP